MENFVKSGEFERDLGASFKKAERLRGEADYSDYPVQPADAMDVVAKLDRFLAQAFGYFERLDRQSWPDWSRQDRAFYKWITGRVSSRYAARGPHGGRA